MSSLQGRIAVVTGASRGVGRGIAADLVAQGVTVAGLSRSADQLANVASELSGLAGEFIALPTDVTSFPEIQAAASALAENYGPVTILVNAAGTFGPIQWIAESDPDAWINTIMVDAVSAFLTTRVFLPQMLEEGWGRIINVSSAASLHPPGPLNSAYGTAKVALNQFTRHLAAEIDGSGVTANVIHPGDLKTEMWADIRDQANALGSAADAYTQWATWVAETGGDPVEKASELVLDLLTEDPPRNGEFCWIREPLQAPIESWPVQRNEQPWRQD